MARTQAADYDQRKAAIVDAAARLYAERGFLGASVADLAARCKTSKSLIYHYYQAKEDILFDVMRSHVHALDTAAQEIAASRVAPEQKLRALAHAFMRLYIGAADRHIVLLNELDNLPKARRAEIVALQKGLIAQVRALIGEIEPRFEQRDKAHVAAMLFFGMINWTHTWFHAQGALSAEVLADMAVDIALGGLRRAARPDV